MTITLVRHGEVDEAFHRCYNGHNDITLSAKGREEAEALACLLKDQTFDAIYSSDLRRCQETVAPIIDQLSPATSATVIPVQTGIHKQQPSDDSNSLIPTSAGMTATPAHSPEGELRSKRGSPGGFPIPHFPSQALREKSWGRHEGMTFDAIVERDGLVYEHFEQWINALDGEPYDAYIKRIRRFFTQTLPQTGYNSVLVVTHAGVIRVLMHILKDITLEEAFSIDFPYSAYTTLNTETWKFGETVCVS